jgi:hypothetical protein
VGQRRGCLAPAVKGAAVQRQPRSMDDRRDASGDTRSNPYDVLFRDFVSFIGTTPRATLPDTARWLRAFRYRGVRSSVLTTDGAPRREGPAAKDVTVSAGGEKPELMVFGSRQPL